MDYDQDGDLDVALGTRTGSNSGDVEIWYNDGSGSFSQTRVMSASGEVNAIVAADLNGDGWPDIAAGTKTSNNDKAGEVEVWTNLQNDHFHYVGGWSSGGKVNTLAVGNMDMDPAPDLVAGTKTGNHSGDVELWINDGSGSMSLEDHAAADDVVLAVALGPIDYGNTYLDIVAGTAARSVQAWFCDPRATDPADLVPPDESWADANAGGVVNAVSVAKVEASLVNEWDDPLYDVVVGTAIGSGNTGEIVIYLNPYVWTLNP